MIYLAREPHVLPFTRHVPMLRGAPWRRVAVLGDSVAEGVREPHDGFRDLSWIERIAEPLGAVAPGLTVMNLGQRDLRASEVRELQLPAALRFRPDLAIVAAGGNDALRRSFSPERVADELDAIAAPLRQAGADLLMLELMDIVASGLVPSGARGRARRAHERAGAGHARGRGTARRDARRDARAPYLRRSGRLCERPPSPERPWPRDRGERGDPRDERRARHEGRGMSDLGLDPLLALELSQEEILDDLCWPNPPPGRWNLDAGGYSANGRPTVSARRNGGSSSSKRESGSAPSASSVLLKKQRTAAAATMSRMSRSLRPSERSRSTSS